MITFYRIEGQSAIPYNGDAPFVNWMGRFSTGLIRYGRLLFEVDKNVNTVTVELPKLPDDWVFALYNDRPTGAHDDGHIDLGDGEQYWAELDRCASASAKAQSVVVGEHKLYSIIILCRSNTEGEFIENITINGQVYKIGCEFWGENESLKIDLANKGVEFTDLIRKAVYSNDVHEDNPDWVLLNRKYRELATNFLDIYGNKGSYKSLINSLKWFEYADLAELREVWRYDTPDGTKYYDRPVQQWLTKQYEEQLFNSAKSTYFVLRSLKRTPIGWEDDEMKYQDTAYDHDSDDKAVATLSCMWSEEEMRLKMALLGAFYEHYFMPIHLNLTRSSIEDYADVLINMLSTSEDQAIDECASEGENDFDLDWDGGDEPDPDDPGSSGSTSVLRLHLDEVHVAAGREKDSPYDMAFQGPPIVACYENNTINTSTEMSDDEANGISELLKRISQQYYNGIGAMATGTFAFDEPIIYGELTIDTYGDPVTTFLKVDEAVASKTFTKTFLFPYLGTFNMLFKFRSTTNKVYTKRVTVEVSDNLTVSLNIMKMVAAMKPNEPVPDPFTALPDEAISHENPINIDPRIWFARTREQHTVPSREGGLVELDEGFEHVQYIPLKAYSDTSAPQDAPFLTRVWTVIVRSKNGYSNELSAQRAIKRLADNAGITENTHYKIGVSEDLSCTWVQYIAKRRGDIPDVQKFPSSTTRTTEYFYRDVFIPEFHKLEDPGNTDVKTIYPIVCQPVINLHMDDGGTKVIPYSRALNDPKAYWRFFSWQKQQYIAELDTSTCTPFLAWEYSAPSPTGYYDVEFSYRFGNNDKTIKKTTPFRLVE